MSKNDMSRGEIGCGCFGWFWLAGAIYTWCYFPLRIMPNPHNNGDWLWKQIIEISFSCAWPFAWLLHWMDKPL